MSPHLYNVCCSQTSPRSLGHAFVFPPPSFLSPSPRARSPSPRSPDRLGAYVGQRVRCLSGENPGEEGGEEESGGEARREEKREDIRRQTQLEQIHKELQNVEVINFFFYKYNLKMKFSPHFKMWCLYCYLFFISSLRVFLFNPMLAVSRSSVSPSGQRESGHIWSPYFWDSCPGAQRWASTQPSVSKTKPAPFGPRPK